jgi:hypothetical protein
MKKKIENLRKNSIKIRLTDDEKIEIYQEMSSKKFSVFAEFARSKLLNIDQSELTKNKNFQDILSQYKSIKKDVADAKKALTVIAKSADKSEYKFDLIEKHLDICAQNSQEIYVELSAQNSDKAK